MNNKVTLTGIKPSGMPHLGNYCGAIKPMIEAVNNKAEDETIYMFIPDIHVVNGGLEPAKIREFTYGMLASYLACGLDPEKVVIFRQSAVRQHAELATLLNNFTPKGMMNRAHSYKAAVDKNLMFLNEMSIHNTNILNGINLSNKDSIMTDVKQYRDLCYDFIIKHSSTDKDIAFQKANDFYSNIKDEYIESRLQESNLNSNHIKSILNHINRTAENFIHIFGVQDQGINMGLYCYPILMAADIILYHTNKVPVGKDQVQHVEMARDIANSFNHRYSETFTLPDYESKEDAPEIAGLDGRKMSKSYGNHIPLFCNENELKSLVKKIITDSALPEEPKDVTNSTLVQLFELFANEAKAQDYKARLAAGGFGYGDAKNELFELLNEYLTPKREVYNKLMADRKALDEILKTGEEKARFVAEKTMRKVRKRMGLVESI